MDELENSSSFLFYNDSHGKISKQVILRDETVWLSQKNMADIFGVQRPSITKHLQKIFEESLVLNVFMSDIYALPRSNFPCDLAFAPCEFLLSLDET